jgi:hypothetical protein
MMKRVFCIGIAVVALHGCGKPSATDRALELEALTMKGEKIELQEWFAPGAENTDFIKVYGGPERLSADSKKRADAEGGIRGIEIVEDLPLPNGDHVISIRTTFNSGKTAESQETWSLIDGEWKILPPPPSEGGP